jgi:hypothetical protein
MEGLMPRTASQTCVFGVLTLAGLCAATPLLAANGGISATEYVLEADAVTPVPGSCSGQYNSTISVTNNQKTFTHCADDNPSCSVSGPAPISSAMLGQLNLIIQNWNSTAVYVPWNPIGGVCSFTVSATNNNTTVSFQWNNSAVQIPKSAADLYVWFTQLPLAPPTILSKPRGK